MRKVMKSVVCTVLAVLFISGSCLAQENTVNQWIQTLYIGTNAYQISGTGTNMLEKLYNRTWNPGVTNNISAVTGNLPIAAATNMLPSAGSYIGGNVPKAAISNALGTAGSTLGGNIPIAAVSNAMGSAGNTIGGNIPIADFTNALSGFVAPYTTQTVVGATNVIDSTGRWVSHNP